MVIGLVYRKMDNYHARIHPTENPVAASGDKSQRVIMQVLIVAYGRRGIESVVAARHPRIPGVEYIVSWQYGDEVSEIPEELAGRPDFYVLPSETRGVACNRNLALHAATAPICLCSDDDVCYTREQLLSVIKAFEERPECGFLTFQYSSSRYPRQYPPCEVELAKMKKVYKGYYATGFEIAFRLDEIRKKGIRFDERFGIGAPFPAGEEDIFMHDVLKAGIGARFVPITIVAHESDTTCMRRDNDPEIISTQGAIHAIVNPKTWPLRMIVYSLRRKHLNLKEKLIFCRYWIAGVRLLRRLRKKHMKR